MKKKKLRKLSLDLLETYFQPIDPDLLKKITGGADGYGYVSTFQIGDGSIANYTYNGNKYAIYTSNSGNTMILNGVHVTGNTLVGQYSDTACYWNEEIRIGSGWQDSFSIDNLLHEYGHHIQRERDGALSYSWNALGSAWSAAWENPDHLNRPWEQEATTLGSSYGASYYGSFGSEGNYYSMRDFEILSELGLWEGGYVEGMSGYVLPQVEVTPSGSNGSSSSSSWWE